MQNEMLCFKITHGWLKNKRKLRIGKCSWKLLMKIGCLLKGLQQLKGRRLGNRMHS